ncbi:MAG TPA: hypothetical protein VFM27_08750 [Acidimicrobiales bacterium]|nr:hypothetical protein [Acidimicrobiales bacterium]
MSRKVVRFWREPPPPGRGDRAPGRPGGPTRMALGTSLALPGLPPPRFVAVDVEWFEGDAGDDLPGDGSLMVPVDEVVVRGADALAARWAGGGERFKMMSLGRRNPALTRAAFAARWRAEAGRLSGDRIPDELRGLAYVQDHPRGDDPPLDAINEVWFDRLDDLRRRAEWFAARPVPADLMSPAECWTAYLREVVVEAHRA